MRTRADLHGANLHGRSLPGWGGSAVALAASSDRPLAWILDDTGGSCVCEAPADSFVPTLWFELTVPDGVAAIEIDAVGGGEVLGPVERPAFGTRVRARVPARAGERLSVRTSGIVSADGGSEVTFTSNWADRWVFAAGGHRRAPSWGPVGAVIEEGIHAGPGRVTIAWRLDDRP